MRTKRIACARVGSNAVEATSENIAELARSRWPYTTGPPPCKRPRSSQRVLPLPSKRAPFYGENVDTSCLYGNNGSVFLRLDEALRPEGTWSDVDCSALSKSHADGTWRRQRSGRDPLCLTVHPRGPILAQMIDMSLTRSERGFHSPFWLLW